MKYTETIKKVILKTGIVMANVAVNTSCPWINYQPCEPKTIIEMRQKKKKEWKNV